MSQKTLDVINGISQAAANAYDGAHDEKGNPIEIGLKREEGHVVNDSRVMDGFNVRVHGKHLLVSYESEVMLSDVYKSANYEDECNQMLEKIVSFLKYFLLLPFDKLPTNTQCIFRQLYHQNYFA